MKYTMAVIILAILLISGSMALSGNITAEMIKATYLEKIANFIEWPDSSVESDSSGTFIIGVVGENKFGDVLDKLYKERKIKNKNVEIRYFSSSESVGHCNILFISKSEAGNLKEILEKAGELNALTVGDTEGYADEGVLVNFYNQGKNIRFEINERAVKNSQLVFSHHLYSAARIIHSEDEHD